MEASLAPLDIIRANRLLVVGLIVLIGFGCNKKSASRPSNNSPPAAAKPQPLRGLDGRWKAVGAEVNGEVRSVKLIGGVENSFDGSIYVRRNEEKPVFTAEGIDPLHDHRLVPPVLSHDCFPTKSPSSRARLRTRGPR